MTNAKVEQFIAEHQARKAPRIAYVVATYNILAKHKEAIRDAAGRANMNESELVRAILDEFFDMQPEVIHPSNA